MAIGEEGGEKIDMLIRRIFLPHPIKASTDDELRPLLSITVLSSLPNYGIG